jgi:vacuolar-type H+-ATPase subunit H
MPIEKELEDTLINLLAVETEARVILEKAEKEAKDLREQTRKEMQDTIEEAKKQEGFELRKALDDAQKQGEAIRAEIIARANKEIIHWQEDLYKTNREKAMGFIFDAVSSI